MSKSKEVVSVCTKILCEQNRQNYVEPKYTL